MQFKNLIFFQMLCHALFYRPFRVSSKSCHLLYHSMYHLDMNDFHVSAVGKKLCAAGKKKGCEEINLWMKGIKNHMYYSVLSPLQCSVI